MQVTILKASIDRETGEILSQEVVGHKEVDEDEFFKPLVEIFYSRIFGGDTPQAQAEGRLAGE